MPADRNVAETEAAAEHGKIDYRVGDARAVTQRESARAVTQREINAAQVFGENEHAEHAALHGRRLAFVEHCNPRHERSHIEIVIPPRRRQLCDLFSEIVECLFSLHASAENPLDPLPYRHSSRSVSSDRIRAPCSRSSKSSRARSSTPAA